MFSGRFGGAYKEFELCFLSNLFSCFFPFLPRMVLRGSKDLSSTIARRQFPIRLAFTMTINKSQGQTMDKIGLYLPQPIFAHGQLYVPLSKTRSMYSIKVLVCYTNK